MFGLFDSIGYWVYEHDERELERRLREMDHENYDFEDDQEEEEEY